jgi:hypothetical protein
MHVTVITRLESRRDHVLRTLDHIRAEQLEAEANTDWKDLCAQRRRSELLAELSGWYNERLVRIDHVLSRVAARVEPAQGNFRLRA